MSRSVIASGVLMTPLLLAAAPSGEVPRKISYQGQLTDDSGQPFEDTTIDVTFSIYRTDGTQVWTCGAPGRSCDDVSMHLDRSHRVHRNCNH